MSTVAAAKAGMDFQAASQRPRCGNCRHHTMEYVDRMPPYDRAGIRCKQGGFMVTAYAVCAKHEPERRASHPAADQAATGEPA